jgi:ornithine cyclodeaminase/alanine dehydrogenase-like protein (mu-crystallin family)
MRKLGLHHAIAVGLVERERRFVELGEIVAGLKPGRQRDAQITVADLTGTPAFRIRLSRHSHVNAPTRMELAQ